MISSCIKERHPEVPLCFMSEGNGCTNEAMLNSQLVALIQNDVCHQVEEFMSTRLNMDTNACRDGGSTMSAQNKGRKAR